MQLALLFALLMSLFHLEDIHGWYGAVLKFIGQPPGLSTASGFSKFFVPLQRAVL